MQRIKTRRKDRTSLNKHRARAIRAAARGEDGIADGGAVHLADRRVEAESLVHDGLEVLARFEAVEGPLPDRRGGGPEGEDVVAKTGVRGWVPGEMEEGVCQRDGGGVVGGEEDVEELVDDVGPVVRCGGEFAH